MVSIENVNNLNIIPLEKTVLSIICSRCKTEDEKIFKKEESIEILKVLGLIDNIEEYQEV